MQIRYIVRRYTPPLKRVGAEMAATTTSSLFGTCGTPHAHLRSPHEPEVSASVGYLNTYVSAVSARKSMMWCSAVHGGELNRRGMGSFVLLNDTLETGSHQLACIVYGYGVR